MGLRRIGLVKEEHGPLFSALVTRVTLPSLIFVSLAKSVLHWEYAVLALLMLAAEIISLGLDWLGGRGLRCAYPGSDLVASDLGQINAMCERLFMP